MRYEHKIALLCRAKGIPHPFDEADLKLANLRYFGGEKVLGDVLGTNWNLGGRLFIEYLATDRFRVVGKQVLYLTPLMRKAGERFFPKEYWNDTSPEKRTLIHWYKLCTHVVLDWKV